MQELRHSLRNRLLRSLPVFNKYVFNRFTITLARSGKGPFSLLFHVGRRTGITHTTPVLATYLPDLVLVPLSYGDQVDWLRNVLAAGSCVIFHGGKTFQVAHPQIIDAQTAIAILPEGRRRLFKRFRLEKFLQTKIVRVEAAA